jgi:hypothetical protein
MNFKYRLVLFVTLLITVISFPVLALAMSISIGIPEKYSEVKAGEKLYFETEVKWPENVGRKDLRIEYYIKNKNGEEVAYLKVLKAIETQASFMDSISIPASIPPGLYKISAQLNDYQELNQEVAASFNVVKENNIIERNLIIIIVVLGVVVFLVVIEMFILMKKNHEK